MPDPLDPRSLAGAYDIPDAPPVNTSRFPWSTVLSNEVDMDDFSAPGGAGSEKYERRYYWVAHIPDGELREIAISFERRATSDGNYNASVDANNQDTLEVAYVYRNTNAGEVEKTEDDILGLAKLSGKDSFPLTFENNGNYLFRFDASDAEADEEALDGTGQVPIYLREVFLRVTVSTGGGSATNYLYRNVDKLHVTGVFGSYADMGSLVNPFIMGGGASGPQPFTYPSPLSTVGNI